MQLDEDVCYRALNARDARFDGQFFVGVVTTGIYCRPVCPARTPLRRNVRFFRTAAAASASGLRACRRCRPDSLPGSRDWDHRSDLVARALRLIGSGAADEQGSEAVASQLHVTARHLNRALVAEVGTTAGQLARTRRAQTARTLLEHTDLTATEVAFAAGFRSVRQFNDVMREQFGTSPTQLRRTPAVAGERERPISDVTVRLQFRPPYPVAAVLGWLHRHAVPGVDTVDVVAGTIHTTSTDGTTVAARFEQRSVVVAIGLAPGADVRSVPHHIAAVRRWLDLDASPAVIDDHLARQAALVPWVTRHAGLRVPTSLDPFRSLTATILGQQVSVAAAATQCGRLTRHLDTGQRFPTAAELAAVDPDLLASALGVPKARGRTLVAVAQLVAGGDVALGPSADRDEVTAVLGAVRGIGPWTIAETRMRALGDPDVWPAGDLVLRREVSEGGMFPGLQPGPCAPWRSYLAHHVWVAHATRTLDASPDARTRAKSAADSIDSEDPRYAKEAQ